MPNSREVIRIDRLTDKLSSIVINHCGERFEKCKEVLDWGADEIIDYIKSNCPRSLFMDNTGIHLADSFVATRDYRDEYYTYTIHSPKKFRIVHLVEYGFHNLLVDRMIPARPFLRPAMEEFAPQISDKIREIIENRK